MNDLAWTLHMFSLLFVEWLKEEYTRYPPKEHTESDDTGWNLRNTYPMTMQRWLISGGLCA